jgi:hypothetical protein
VDLSILFDWVTSVFESTRSITSLSNKINNIVNTNANMTQSKVLVDPLLSGLLEEEKKLTLMFFEVTLKISLKKTIFQES